MSACHAHDAPLVSHIHSCTQSPPPFSHARAGFWGIKIPIFVILHIASIFITSEQIIRYGWFAAVGAVLFIFVQIVLLISVAYSINKFTVQTKESNGWKAANLLMSLVMLAIAVAVVVVAARWFTMGGKCRLNSFFLYSCVALVRCHVCMCGVVAVLTPPPPGTTGCSHHLPSKSGGCYFHCICGHCVWVVAGAHRAVCTKHMQPIPHSEQFCSAAAMEFRHHGAHQHCSDSVRCTSYS